LLENGIVLTRVLAVVVSLLVSMHVSIAGQVRGIPRIVDADTIYIGPTKVRFAGIDAPETEQVCLNSAGKSWACGIDAKQQLESFSRNREWTCDLSGEDRYGRSLGSCTIAEESVSRWLVRSGWALAFRRYSMDFVPDENFAREHQHGLWSGAFIAPWDWRHRTLSTVILGALVVPTGAQRALTAASTARTLPPSHCLIKGNLSSVPQCIYHVPGSRFYDRLTMQPSFARRWFCTEAEAEAAGCRKSKL
jgi:endonuclease YncB( thermonuclease family)